MLDCTKLQGRLRQICEGTSGLPPEVEQQYRDLWEGNPPKPIEPPRTACVYRGQQIDWVECDTCTDKHVQVRVFQCDLFNRCVLANGTSYRYCGSCTSRLENQSEVS